MIDPAKLRELYNPFFAALLATGTAQAGGPPTSPRRKPPMPAASAIPGDDEEDDDDVDLHRLVKDADMARERGAATAAIAAEGGGYGAGQRVRTAMNQGRQASGQDIPQSPALAEQAVEKWIRFAAPKPSRAQFEAAGTTEQEAMLRRAATVSKNRARTAKERAARDGESGGGEVPPLVKSVKTAFDGGLNLPGSLPPGARELGKLARRLLANG